MSSSHECVVMPGSLLLTLVPREAAKSLAHRPAV